MKLATLLLSFIFSFQLFAAGFLPNANIVKIHGKAFINNEVIAEGAEVATGMEIKIPKIGDYVIIKFQNGHKVRLTAATVKVEELTEKVSIMNLMRGQFHTLVKKLTEGEKFEVKTKYASFGVRGTKFGITIEEKKDKAYLCVCEGVVEAIKGDGDVGQYKAQVKANQDLWVGNDSKKLQPAKSSKMMFNMTNNIIKEMEKI